MIDFSGRTICRTEGKMRQILCSTGAFLGRPNGRNYRLLEVYVPQLACDGIEFIMYDSWYGEIDELTGYLKKLKLNIPVLHCEKKLTEGITRGGREETAEAYRLFEINCRLAGEIGARKTVIHLWNGPISDTAIDNNVRAFGDLRVTGHSVLHHDDMKAVNTEAAPDTVKPVEIAPEKDVSSVILPAASWNVIQLGK